MGSIMKSVTKGRSKANLRAGLPRNVKSMSKEVLEATLQKKRECNAVALKIVENLLERNVREEWFLESLKYINDTHFQDVIEERAITKLCGYPLCNHDLGIIPQQQYRISTMRNKVYDITERKNFCSNQCYKASNYVKNQLLTSPLWLRDKEEIPDFKILRVNCTSGMVGDEVQFAESESIKEEVAQLNEKKIQKLGSDVIPDPADNALQIQRAKNLENVPGVAPIEQEHKEEGLGESEQNENKIMSVADYRDDRLVENSITSKITEAQECAASTVPYMCPSDEPSVNKVNVHFSDEKQISALRESSMNDTKTEGTSKTTEDNNLTERKIKNQKHDTKSSESPVSTRLIEKCLREWFSLDSMYFLYGEEVMREMVADKDIKHYYKPTSSDAWDSSMQQRYIAICKKLNLMELEDANYDSKITTEKDTLKPLPDYASIREEGLKMQLKVKAYYGGKTAYEEIPSQEAEPVEEPSNNFLPLVDLHSKNALRRRIVLDRFNRILPDLLSTFGILSRDISGDLRSLVFSFSLAAHNITFKPAEWTLLGLIMLKMLSIKDKRIQIALETPQARKYLTMMLMVFEEDGGYLDRLMAWLTDIDHILLRHSGRDVT